MRREKETNEAKTERNEGARAKIECAWRRIGVTADEMESAGEKGVREGNERDGKNENRSPA